MKIAYANKWCFISIYKFYQINDPFKLFSHKLPWKTYNNG
jgi:hypothetical protein